MKDQDRRDAEMVVQFYREGLPYQEALLKVALLRRKRDGGSGA